MNYQKKKIIELMCIANERGIKYYGQMKKGKLIEMLKANDEDPSVVNDPEFDEERRKHNEEWKKNNPERMQKYLDKNREAARLRYHEKKKEAEEKSDEEKTYLEMSIIELQRIAAIKKIKYRTTMPKNKLIEVIEANDKDPSFISDPELTEKYKKIGREKWHRNAEKYREKSRERYHRKRAKKIQETQSE